MKAAVVILLQVILLFLLPGMNGALYRMDEMVRSFRDEDYIGNGRNHSLPTLKTFGVCYDAFPDTKAGVHSTGNLKRQSKIRGGLSSKMCYRNIRIIFTPKCNVMQLTDFTNMIISDFCIGETIKFRGDIYFYVGMSRPSAIMISFSRSMPPDSHASRRFSLKQPLLRDSPTCLLDACQVLGLLRCPQNRFWCDCPIKRENVLLDSDIFIEHDFLPDDFGTGEMYAHMTLQTPEDDVCLNFAFERVKQLNTE